MRKKEAKNLSGEGFCLMGGYSLMAGQHKALNRYHILIHCSVRTSFFTMERSTVPCVTGYLIARVADFLMPAFRGLPAVCEEAESVAELPGSFLQESGRFSVRHNSII